MRTEENMNQRYALDMTLSNHPVVSAPGNKAGLSVTVKSLMWMFAYFIIVLPGSLVQAQTNVFKLNITIAPEFRDKVDLKTKDIRNRLINKYTHEGIRYSDKSLNKAVRQEYAEGLTLKEFMTMITPDSKAWFEKFFDNFRGKDLGKFREFYEANKGKTLKQIKLLNMKAGRSKKPDQGAPKILAPCPSATDPNHSFITGSMMVIRNLFECEKRDVITTPNQSLYLRGRYDNNQLPFFPDYDNSYCDNCCGPAAGQSILEWFNVPVTKSDGTVLKSTHDIQDKLAHEMETTDGIDFTYPGDLASTLEQEKYAQGRGYCYENGGGSLGELNYKLSMGSPVILLIGWASTAHYVTVYGFDQSRNVYFTANGRDANRNEYSAGRLDELWSFDDISVWAEGAYDIVDVNSNTMFAYGLDECNANWKYTMLTPSLEDAKQYPGMDIEQMYYAKFNDQYVKNKDYESFNFYAYILQFMGMNAYHVSSGGRNVHLSQGNIHIVDLLKTTISTSAMPMVTINIGIDKLFLDTYSDLQCTFNVRDQNHSIVLENSGKCRDYVNALETQKHLYVYVLQYAFPYNTAYKTVDFVLHGGFRTTDYHFPVSSLGLRVQRLTINGLGAGPGESMCYTKYVDSVQVTAYTLQLTPTAFFTSSPSWQIWTVPMGQEPSGPGQSVPTDPGQMYDGGWFKARVSPNDANSLIIAAAGHENVIGQNGLQCLPSSVEFYVAATGSTNLNEHPTVQTSFAGGRISDEDHCTSPISAPDQVLIPHGDPPPDNWINEGLWRAVLACQYLEANGKWQSSQPFPDRLDPKPEVNLKPIFASQQALLSSLKGGSVRDVVNDFFSLRNGERLSRENAERLVKFLNVQSLVSFK